MQQPIETATERPNNYLVRSIIFLLVLSPLCLLLGASSLYTAWKILTGPPVISEIPGWMSAFFELLRVVVALIGFFTPIVALIQAFKVNSEFDAGNYVGATNASKTAAKRCRESLILLILLILIMAVDLLRYFSKT